MFARKPAAVLSVSPGPIGGARAQAHLKTVLGGMLAELFPHPELAIGMGNERIREGRVVDETTRRLLSEFLARFCAWAAAR